MKFITVATLKGGVGKSSTLFNIAGLLAEDNKKVLVIDVDPQANITNNFGINLSTSRKSIKNIFEEELEPQEIVIKNPVYELDNIDIIPSSIFLTSTEMAIVSQSGRENILKNYIEDNIDFFNEYDYILMDTNPSMSIINQNAFVISDSIILVSDVSMNSINGAELFIALWKNIRKRLRLANNVNGLIVNMYDKRIKLSKEFFEYCKKNNEVNKILFDTYIPTNVKIKESEVENRPINIYDKKSIGYSAYIDIYEKMIERGIL